MGIGTKLYKILTICIFVLVMFSTVNGTAGGILSPKAYSPNMLLQLQVKRLLQHVSTQYGCYDNTILPPSTE